MTASLYKVIFCSQYIGWDKQSNAKSRIAKAYRLNKKKLERLFSGKKIIIQKNVSYDKAMRVQESMARHGAICIVKPIRNKKPRIKEEITTELLYQTKSPQDGASTFPLAPVLDNVFVGTHSSNKTTSHRFMQRRTIDRRIQQDRRDAVRIAKDRRQFYERREDNQAWEGFAR